MVIKDIKDIPLIIVSSLIGASSSMCLVIFAGRRYYNSFFNIFWSLKVHGLFICCLIILLLIITFKRK